MEWMLRDRGSPFDHPGRRLEPRERQVLGEAGERRLRNEADDLAGDDAPAAPAGQPADEMDDLGERDGDRVVDVDRYLDAAPAEVDRDRPDARRAAARLADPCGDL